MEGFYLPDLRFILPEGVLIFSALYILLEGAFRTNITSFSPRFFNRYALLALIIAFAILIIQYKAGERWVTFEGQVFQDDFVFYIKALILVGSGAVFTMSIPFMVKENLISFEYSALVLFATAGMLLMVESNDFMVLFIGLEMQGLALYILAGLNRQHLRVSEAALKYFILGAIGTCLYVYGVSLVYGYAGSTSFDALASVIRIESNEGISFGLIVGLVFIIASLSFKTSIVPFHMWTPDVYQGCPTPITAFIAGAPKVAAMAIFLRVLLDPFELLYGEWQTLLVMISIASMVLGTFAALRQSDLKRLLAYSAISQMGYALMGIAAGNEDGIQAVIVYLTLYLVMIVGTFGCLLSLRGKNYEGIQSIEDLTGISNLHPKISFIFAVFMFSLSGIPPLAGFFAKFYVFKAAISAGLFNLAIVGVLTSVVSAFYYLKIVKVMYFDDVPQSPSLSYGQTAVLSTDLSIVLNLCAGIIMLFFLYPNFLLEFAQRAALSLMS